MLYNNSSGEYKMTNYTAFLQDLNTLLQYKSVIGNEKENAPFSICFVVSGILNIPVFLGGH